MRFHRQNSAGPPLTKVLMWLSRGHPRKPPERACKLTGDETPNLSSH